MTPPRVGQSLQVEISDPSNARGAATAATFWLAAAAPAPGHPLPLLIPFGGSASGVGEAFLDPMAIGFVSAPVALVPGTTVATHGVTVPANPALVGMDLFTQGLLIDTTSLANLIVTNGLDLHLGL